MSSNDSTDQNNVTKHHWIRDDIQIDFKLPKYADQYLEMMEKYDKEENYAYYEWFDAFDIYLKYLYTENRISQSQWDILYIKYKGESL